MRKHSPEKMFPCTFSVPIGTLIYTQLLVNSAKTERRLHLSPKVTTIFGCLRNPVISHPTLAGSHSRSWSRDGPSVFYPVSGNTRHLCYIIFTQSARTGEIKSEGNDEK